MPEDFYTATFYRYGTSLKGKNKHKHTKIIKPNEQKIPRAESQCVQGPTPYHDGHKR